jgi:uncharacterized protein YkwD
MAPRRLLAASTAALALCLAAPAAASAACADTEVLPTAETLPVVATATVCLLNEERAAHGLDPVQENTALTKASLAYSQRLVTESFFAHEAPDGTDVVDRLTATGYIRPGTGWEVGENLAWAQGALASPRNVVKAWMESPGHRANVLTRAYREVGIGVVLGTPKAGPDGSTFTTNFGRRDAAPVGEQPGSSDSFTKATSAATGAKPTPAAKVQAAKKARAKKAKQAKQARARRAAKRRAAARRAHAARSARAAARSRR